MKISQIEQVIEIAKTGSISQAAINLYISQPNLSQSIKKLEEEIGTAIFRRTNNGVELTGFGNRFVSNAKEVLLRMKILDDLCDSQTKLKPMKLSVASGGYLFFNQTLAELFQKYSNYPINFNYYESDSQRQIQLLKDGKVELGIGSVWSFYRRSHMKNLVNSGIEYHYLTDAIPGIYVDSQNPLFSEQDKVVDLEKIKNLPFVSTSDRPEFYDVFFHSIYPNEALSNLKCATRMIYTENSGAMRDMLFATKGFAIASYCKNFYENEKFYNSLRFIPFKEGFLSCEVGFKQLRKI